MSNTLALIGLLTAGWLALWLIVSRLVLVRSNRRERKRHP